MPVQACPNPVNQCLPCLEEPIVNLSAEAADQPVYFAIVDYNPDIPGNWNFSKQGCKSWCFSTVSQEAADACALAQAQDCVVDPGGPGGPCTGICLPGDGNATFYLSNAQECSGTCGDGSVITVTSPAGTYRSLISQADADLHALAICRAKLREIGTAFCADITPMCFDSGAETSTEYQYQFPSAVGSPPWTYSLIAGALPLNFTLEPSGYLHGFPVAAGIATFTIQAVDQVGTVVTRPCTIQICEITSPVELTEAPVGTAYSETLTQTGGIAPFSWQIVPEIGDGLPPGLTLNEQTGIISGTPSDPTLDPANPPPDDLIYHFRVRFQDHAS